MHRCQRYLKTHLVQAVESTVQFFSFLIKEGDVTIRSYIELECPQTLNVKHVHMYVL